MSKQPSIGEVAAISKLFLKFCHLPLQLLIALILTVPALDAAETNYPESTLPSEITTLDQREFAECQLIRAEPDALLIRHSKGIARLSFAILSTSLKETFHYNPKEAHKAAMAHYEKERYLQMWKFREEETVRAMRKHELITDAIRSTWIPAEATVIRANKNGIYVSAKRIVSGEGGGRVLKRFGPSCLFLPENSLNLRPGSLWKGYICPSPDNTVLDLNGEMFTVPFHQALTVGCQNTGGT